MKALIIYRDVASAIRAKATLQSLRPSPGVAVRCEVRPWRVDMLEFPACATEALIEATDAHLILFTGGFPGPLPFWLMDWLGRWAGVRQVKDAALAATAGTNGNCLSPIMRSVLHQFALEHDLHFITGAKFAHEAERQFCEDTKETEVPWIQSIRPIYTPVFEPYQHWGINE